jgi:hypothetical protein
MLEVPHHVQNDHKPNVSHLHIFGSTILKVCVGKLKVTVIKCRWWADKTKWYCLEGKQTGKLITLPDVWFIEDDQPNDLEVIERNA